MNAASREWMFEYSVSCTLYFENEEHIVHFLFASKEPISTFGNGPDILRREIELHSIGGGFGAPLKTAIWSVSLLAAPPESEQTRDIVLHNMRRQRSSITKRLRQILDSDKSDTDKVAWMRSLIDTWTGREDA